MTVSTTEKVVGMILGIASLAMMVGGAYLGSRAGQDARFKSVENRVLMIEATYPDKKTMVDVIKEAITHHVAVPHPSSAPKQMLLDTKEDILELKAEYNKALVRQEKIRDTQIDMEKDLVEIKTMIRSVDKALKEK